MGGPGAPDIVILGGGPAGLATAWALEEAGRPYVVLEAAAAPGGNARTLRHGDFRYDTGPHRFHDRDPEATRRVMGLLGSDLHEVEAPSRILWNGRLVDFPLQPLQALLGAGLPHALRATSAFVRARVSGTAGRESGDFAGWATHRFGAVVADAFLIPFSEKLWGLPASELSPEIAGRRLPGFSLGAILREAVFGRPGRHLEGRFLYPRWGYGQIVEAMAARLTPGRLRCGWRVVRVIASGEEIRAVQAETGGQLGTIESAAVVNTLPITLLVRILEPPPPAEVIDAARHLRFRDMVLVALFLDQPAVSEAACLYFPQRELEFTRAHEPRNRSSAMSPVGKTSLVVEFPCFEGDPVWTRDDAALTRGLVSELERLGVFEAARVEESAVVRLRKAYPVYSTDYRQWAQPVLDYLRSFRNLATLGRSGGFFYGHVHDFIAEGFAIAEAVARTLDGRTPAEQPVSTGG
jgi:protoporphyrinogen oxidase